MEQQPNSDLCFVCGRKNPAGLYMQFYDNGKDEVYSDYTVASRYQSYPGIVHGGILASMLDEVVGRVGAWTGNFNATAIRSHMLLFAGQLQQETTA